MRHIEMHLTETVDDARSMEYLGLIRFEDEEYCEHCLEPIAYVDDEEFEPCVIVLDEDGSFLICIPCASPVLTPGEDL
jgi:hypothetical protein